ncbi:MAG: threonylcarbamoyl-AMP synthase [Candidatus Marinimicrobia bacterium]|nr:threonylcarbamoyl-AMP synthase [Candidatus Neomarinimicrobiota bacterium]MCF7904889.1 threonylcarbamoyl-AMP synthase [Candidatus Neomarinimicrobiota bacterium]
MQIIDFRHRPHTLNKSDKTLIISALENESVIVYPTDTLYGLGADVRSESAIETLYRLKSRADSPVSVLAESVDSLIEMSKDLNDKALELIQTFLPGPMTVICHTEYPFNERLFSNKRTIGFRVPGDDISRQIPRLLGRPVTTTSVNPVGEKPAASVENVRAYYAESIPLMLDVGALKQSAGSTVMDLTSQPFNILREGEISRLELQEFLN